MKQLIPSIAWALIVFYIAMITVKYYAPWLDYIYQKLRENTFTEPLAILLLFVPVVVIGFFTFGPMIIIDHIQSKKKTKG